MFARWFPGADRRAYPRQARQQRVLLLLDDCALGEPYRGVLLDTSAGGLRPGKADGPSEEWALRT